MVRIRLRRTGKKKQPSYRLVVADSRSPRDGRFIEIIGHYNPIRQPKELHIKAERARYWLSVGAQPTDTVVYLFKQTNILNGEGQVIPLGEIEETDSVSMPAPTSPSYEDSPASAPEMSDSEHDSEHDSDAVEHAQAAT